MNVDLRRMKQVIIVDLQGKLVRGTGDEVLREVINRLLADGWTKILLNLSGVPSVDSSGIGELIAARRVAEKFDATIRLQRLSSRVKGTLQLSLVLPLFEIYENEEEAIESFRIE